MPCLSKVLPTWLTRLRPWQLTLAVLAIYLTGVLRSAGWDPMALVRVGSRFDPGLSGGTMGYDGQFSYQIAISPLESPQRLDSPAYRLQRILYPMAARIAGLGAPSLIPWALVLVNVAAIVAGVAVTESILVATHNGRWWAMAYGLNAGMLMAARLDLTEPVAYLLVQVGVLEWVLARPRGSAVAFAAALLAKEVVILIVLGYLIVHTVKQGIRSGGAWAVIALGPFILWQAGLSLWLGELGLGPGGALSTPFEILPLRGWWGTAIHDPAGFLVLSILIVPVVIVPAIIGVIVAVKALRSGKSASAVALLAQAGAYLFLPTSNLVDPLGSARFTVGLIAAFLNLGAELRWSRVLSYSQLWMLTLLFVPGDRLLPSG